MLLAAGMLLAGTSPAHAADLENSVERVELTSQSRTLTLYMDRPKSADSAALISRQLRDEAREAAGPEIVRMGCNLIFSPSDSNGTLGLECFCNLRQIRWTCKVSSKIQAIIIGPMTETGLWYFVNGVRQPRNSPHLAGSRYLLHGTMSGLDTGDIVDYQDYIIFRHNIGPGGARHDYFCRLCAAGLTI